MNVTENDRGRYRGKSVIINKHKYMNSMRL